MRLGLRGNLWDTIKTLMDLKRGVTDCIRLLQEEKPDMVIGTGGYVTAPLMMARYSS